MKKLTINETWEQCLAMWKWISRRCEKGKVYLGSSNHVPNLKVEYLNDIGIRDMSGDCFFCDMSTPNDDLSFDCNNCPAKKVDRHFDCCSGEYNFEYSPRLFYAKLKELNKIRLPKK